MFPTVSSRYCNGIGEREILKTVVHPEESYWIVSTGDYRFVNDSEYQKSQIHLSKPTRPVLRVDQ